MAKRVSVAAGAAVAVMLALAGAVVAATPSNDTYAGRVRITTIPFSDTVDTTDATTGGNDNTLGPCFQPATDATVWYELTGTAQQLRLDVTESDYSAGVIVATGNPGSFTFVDCGAGQVSWFAEAGTPYTILVFDDQTDGGGNGGTLRISVSEAAPAACTIVGTDGDDVLTGTTGADFICGLGGDDVLIGFGGDDVILGGTGRDVLEGYGGKDSLAGGRGHDLLIGGRGFDRLYGRRGVDECYEATGIVIECEAGRF